MKYLSIKIKKDFFSKTFKYFSVFLGCFAFVQGELISENSSIDTVTVAILAKDKAHALPLYLSCLEEQTWPAEKTHLYIRTNNNNDETAEILREWLSRVGHRYCSVYFDDTNVPQKVEFFKPHEWNWIRFKVLGKIRQDSLKWAKDKHSHYFVSDCDNFILPNTIEEVVKTNLPIVAPFLKNDNEPKYYNYFAGIDSDGQAAYTPHDMQIFNQEIKGLFDLPIVECTYFIHHNVLDEMCYDDDSHRYEFIIFSQNARQKGIPQYVDNRQIFGYITVAETLDELIKEPWIGELPHSKEIISKQLELQNF